MHQYLPLLNHLVEARRWKHLSPTRARCRQLLRFRRLFEYAREHAPFYQRLYRDAGVDSLVIRDWADIERVPLVDKAMLRSVPTEELMTRPITPDLVRVTTSGSTGEPFVIYQTRYEQYTSHVRVFAMLWALGWRPWQRILMLWRLEPDAVLPVEQDLGLLTRLRRQFGLFQRDITSIYTPMPEVVRWLDANSAAAVFWSTPGIATVLCDHLEQQGRHFKFPLIVLASETLSPDLHARCRRMLGARVVSHYGLMECPTIGYAPADDNHFRIQNHACALELVNHRIEGRRTLGDVVLTNLVNHTMPFIRFCTNDISEVLAQSDCPARVLGPILGRVDDVLTLPDGRRLAPHLLRTLFMDFPLCTQFKFVQHPDGRLTLQLRLRDGEVPDMIREAALARWRTRFAEVPLAVEFVETMPVDTRSGKFKIIERMGQHPATSTLKHDAVSSPTSVVNPLAKRD